jgi:hypothetical protein
MMFLWDWDLSTPSLSAFYLELLFTLATLIIQEEAAPRTMSEIKYVDKRIKETNGG